MSSAIGVIQGFHAVIGGLRQEQHWFVNDADARRYGQAMANAARHFPLKTTQKALDISMFMLCAASIEIPRIGLSIQRSRAPKQPQRGPAQVFQFVQPSSPNAPQNPSAPAAATSPHAPTGGEGAGPLPPIAEGPADFGSIGGEFAT